MSKLQVAAWETFRQRLKSKLTQESYDAWFKRLTLVVWDGSRLRLAVPNRYVKQWIETHYRRELLVAAAEIVPETETVQILVAKRAAASTSSPVGAMLEKHALAPESGARENGARPAHIGVRPSAWYRLDNFVAGPANRLALAACQTVAEAPAAAYNPLFLHGGPGLGKTHLLQGLAAALHERQPLLRVRLISCEAFANDYIRAVQRRKIDAFRQELRRSQALLIDDVQFLSGKEKTQEEFLHTFDVLRHLGCQIVAASHLHPREIKRLDERLVARFVSGLVARLTPPASKMRVALIHAKARGRGLTLDAECAELLAARIDRSVRELEGAVCKLAALSAAERRAPGKAMVRTALRELGYLREGPLSLDEILEAVVHHQRQSADAIRGGKRHAALVRARHMAMYLAKNLTAHNLAEIGRFFGNRDHSSVLYAVRKIERESQRDKNLREELQALRTHLGR